jgi:hypothetical protein
LILKKKDGVKKALLTGIASKGNFGKVYLRERVDIYGIMEQGTTASLLLVSEMEKET